MSIVTDLSVNKKWEARKGDDNNFTITFVDTSAAAFDLTGYVFSLQIYVYSNKSTPQLSLTEGSGITNGDDSGIVTFKVTDVQSDALRADSYFYQIKAVFPDANTHILFQGEFELVEFQSNNSVSSGVTATLNLNGSNVTATITLAGGGATTASNGLTKTGDDIALGGTLTKTTGIVGAHSIIFNGQTSFAVINAGAINLRAITTSVILEAGGGVFTITASDTIFQDKRAAGNQEGIQYSASGYVTQPLSLTTKEYVDSAIPADVTASNGLTKTGDDIALGGTLTGTTAINLDGNSFSINNGLNINFSVQNLGSFNMIGSTGSVNFQDIRSTKRGIEYGASGYVTQPLSLTTKEWVEALFAVPVKFPSYTVATLPTATAAQQIYVSDETGGAVMAFSDGTNWRRCTDRAIVS